MRGVRSRSNSKEQAAVRTPSGAPARSWWQRLQEPFVRLVTFLRDVRVEMQRVVWPSKEETYTYTIVVVVAVVVVAAWVGLWDTIMTQLIAAIKFYR
jgi:preprotein translocase subunit SecE